MYRFIKMNCLCVYCGGKVTVRHQAISCGECERWAHRRCLTGISEHPYKKTVKREESIPVRCRSCTKFSQALTDAYHESTDLVPASASTSDAYMNTTLVNGSPRRNKVRRSATCLRDDVVAQQSPDVSLISSLVDRMHISPSAMKATMDLNASFVLLDEPTECPSVPVTLPYDEPQPVTESSIHDRQPPTSPVPPPQPITYELMTGGSQKGKDLLIDSNGYTYVIKAEHGHTVRYRCTIRNSTMECTAGVIFRGGKYKATSRQHKHWPDPKKGVTARIMKKAKDVASKDGSRSAASIIEECSNVETGLVSMGAENKALAMRRVNRWRHKLRTGEPINLDFVKQARRSDQGRACENILDIL